MESPMPKRTRDSRATPEMSRKDRGRISWRPAVLFIAIVVVAGMLATRFNAIQEDRGKVTLQDHQILPF